MEKRKGKRCKKKKKGKKKEGGNFGVHIHLIFLAVSVFPLFFTEIGFLKLLLELSSVPSIYPSSFTSNPSSIPLCPGVKGQLYLLGL